MENNCLNCNHPILENFCSHCGQKKYKRIDRKYVIDEAQYLMVHTNKGFFYSLKKIIQNPGKTAREFIDGNRVNHYKPILLAFLLSGIAAFLSFKVLGFNEIMQDYYTQQKLSYTPLTNLMSFVSSYSAAIMVFLIPVISVFTKLLFRKWGQNYYEHVIMNAFFQCYYTIITVVLLYPLLYFFRHDSSVFAYLIGISMFAIPFIMVWFYKGFYHERSLRDIILKVLLFALIGFVGYVITVFAIIIGIVIIQGPEALLQFQQPK